jgi:hemoglobin-like flavoprotein
MLRQDQSDIVEKTWSKLMKRPVQFESTFLKYLTEIEPRIQDAYTKERLIQPTPAATIIDQIVKSANSIETVLRSIINKYSCYGIKEECVDKISLAFLLAIEELLRPRWNDSVRDTWAIFIVTVIQISKRKALMKEIDKVHL